MRKYFRGVEWTGGAEGSTLSLDPLCTALQLVCVRGSVSVCLCVTVCVYEHAGGPVPLSPQLETSFSYDTFFFLF